MGLGNKLLDRSYTPQDTITNDSAVHPFYFKKVIKCPVQFTQDPIEYAEKYLNIRLRPTQKQILNVLFNRDVHGDYTTNEVVVIAGMRGGKSLIAGLAASFILQQALAMDSPAEQLGQVKGYKLSGEFIATSEQQSKNTAYSSFESLLMNTDWWNKYIGYLLEREISEGKETLFQHQQRKIYFPEKNLEVLSLHSNSQSIAGMTAMFVIFDEMSRFNVSDKKVQEVTEKRTAQAVYYTASRAAKSLKGFSKIMTITSPMYESDFGMKLLYMAEKVYGGSQKHVIDALRSKEPKRVPGLIGFHYTTFEMNPKTPDNPSGFVEEDFEAERISSPEAYRRDYLAIPPSALNPWIEYPERIDPCVHPNKEKYALFEDKLIEESVETEFASETRRYIGKTIYLLKHDKITKHFICCDQGEVKDSFVVSMGHGEEVTFKGINAAGKEIEETRYKAVIDLIEIWKPDKEQRITVSFANVEEIIKTLTKSFYVSKVVYDQWQSVESIQRLFSQGVYTQKMGASLEMYDILKILIYSGMIEFPKNDDLVTELRQLNLVRGSKIDHPVSGSKDIADAVCRVAYCIYEDCIRDAIQGNYILPLKSKLPTIRSIASAYEYIQQDQTQFGMDGTSEIFGGEGGGVSGAHDLFGNGYIVQPNVVPNIGVK